jgi:NAD(P)-dependent dehydrogenase (short-subunit alcohol dehydrogenase family)
METVEHAYRFNVMFVIMKKWKICKSFENFGKVDVLLNNAAVHFSTERLSANAFDTVIDIV